MKSRVKIFFKSVWGVVLSFIVFLLCFGGANAIIVNLSAHFVANKRIEFFNFFVALIFIVPGLLIFRAYIRRNESWRYPIGISSLLMSSMLIINFFTISDYIARKKTGIEADVYKGVVNTYLVFGLIIALTALILIGYQIVHDKKIKKLKQATIQHDADIADSRE